MDKKLKYLVIDDDELDRMATTIQASKYPFLQKVGSCKNGKEALDFIQHLKPDIVFSDIEMPEMNGIEMIKELYGQIPVPVFITSHPEFALESYNLEMFDYILKPLTAERFERCAERIKDFFNLRNKVMALDEKSEDENYIIVKQGYDKHKLHITDIIMLESMKDYTKIKTITGQSLLVLESISSFLGRLPQQLFVRIHRSYAINKRRVTAITTNKITLQEIELPIGKSYKQQVADLLS